MRYGFVAYRGVPEEIEYALKYGLDHIEFDLTKISLSEIEKNAEMIKNCKKTVSLHLPWDYSFNPQKCDEDLGYFEKVVGVANEISAEYLVIHLGYYEDGERSEHLGKAMRFIEKALKTDLNCPLLIENLKPKSQISNKIFLGGEIEDFDKIFNEINDARLKMCFDIGHAAYTWDIHKALKHFKDKIYSIHLHDNNGKKDHLPMGKGLINWGRIKKELEELNLKGPIIFEIFDVPFHKSVEGFEKLV